MIGSDFVEAARRERQRLFAELRQNPTFNQWWALRNLLQAYNVAMEDGGAPESVHRGQNPAAVNEPRPSAAVRPEQRRAGSRSAQIEAAAAAWFRQHGKRAQSLEIMRALEQQGFEFTGAKPTAALASVLSHSALFNNVRGEGYGLAEWPMHTTGEATTSLDVTSQDRPDGEEPAQSDSSEPAQLLAGVMGFRP